MDICTVREPNPAPLTEETAGDAPGGAEANKKEPQWLGSGDAVGVYGGWHAGREAPGTWETHSAPRANGVGDADEPEASRRWSGSQITS